MGANSFGRIFCITTFGESHGPATGVVIDGCPAGLAFDESLVHNDLQRRKPGQSGISSSRQEMEAFQVLSGVFEGKTTGAPIAILIPNTDAKPADYDKLKDTYRPSHADYTYDVKYGIRDHRGGGRSSARTTAAWVAAGAVAKMLLHTAGIQIQAYVSRIGPEQLYTPYTGLDIALAENNPVRCPDAATAQRMEQYIETLKAAGDSCGGEITGLVKNCPAGLGEPQFNKLHATLAQAMFTINAVKGFEYGAGFDAAGAKGSELNDRFLSADGKISTATNFSGGIQGGISNGEDIYFRVAFKPVATIQQAQRSVNSKREEVILEAGGRHDPCVVPRAVPIVEAMTALVLADQLLLARLSKLIN